jgi:hypothetical protein
MTTHIPAPPSKTSPTSKYTEPLNVSNLTKAQVPTAIPIHFTNNAANFLSHTSALSTEPPLTSNTIPQNGNPQPLLCYENQENPTTHDPKPTVPSPSSKPLSKTLLSVVSKDIVHLAETHHLLPANHFGGCPGRSTTNSLMLAVHWTFEKWRKGLVVSGLFLDISGAFPNAVITRVVHNMRRRQIPIEYTQWIT